MKYIVMFCVAAICFFSGYYIGYQRDILTADPVTIKEGDIVAPAAPRMAEEIKQPFNKNQITALKSQAVSMVSGNRKEGWAVQKETAIESSVQQVKSESVKLDRSDNIADINIAKKEFISAMRDDGIPEEDIKHLAEAFPDPIPIENWQRDDAADRSKKRIAAVLQQDGLPEEDIEMLSTAMAESGVPFENNILYSTAEMTEKNIQDMKDDGLPEEDIDLLREALAVSEEGNDVSEELDYYGIPEEDGVDMEEDGIDIQ